MTNGNWREHGFTARSLDDVAYQDEDGQWRAGPDSSHPEGTQLDAPEANRARSLRQYHQTWKGIAWNNPDISDDEAKELAKDLRDRLENVEDPDEIRDIRREILGYE